MEHANMHDTFPDFAMRERPLRIGAVSYLNSKPLIEDLADLARDADLILDVPSRLADDLSANELDVALIPSIEVLRDADYEIVSDACVATRGPVLSVKLFSRVPVERVRTLALDAGSRTSATLARILLAERFGVRPTTELLPLGFATADTSADAVLLIGDRAMKPPHERFVATWDLGEEWSRWTGLPFVFAMWAARRDCELGDVEEALCLSRDRGVERLAVIAEREARKLGITAELAYDYLAHNLHFTLGTAEREGLRLFQELAIKLGLAPEGVDLVFRHCMTRN
jgi:chorismate dehydratase